MLPDNIQDSQVNLNFIEATSIQHTYAKTYSLPEIQIELGILYSFCFIHLCMHAKYASPGKNKHRA